MAVVDVVQVDATTKTELRTKLKSAPETVRFVPAGHDPLALAFKTSADRIPVTPHSARVHGPKGKWTATVTSTRNGLTVK